MNIQETVPVKPRSLSSRGTLVLLTLTAAVFIVSYVETMILPAVPRIQADFSSTSTEASWITSIVLLVGAACSPIFGRLADVHGKKRMLLLAFAFYIIGVGLGGFSPSMYFFIFSRALQGLGFAVLPLSLAMVTDIFPKEKLATVQGTIAGVAAISATAGLVLGSYVVQELGWRDAFYTATILSMIFFLIASKLLKESSDRAKARVDYVGSFLLIGGITLALLYLTESSSLGWHSLVELVILIPGITLCILFFFFEQKTANPLIDLNFIRIRNVLVANVVSVISGLGNFMLFYAFIYYAELPKPSGLGLTELATGMALAPATLVMLAVGPLAGKAITRLGPKPIMLAGSLTLIAGFALFILNRPSELSVALDAVISMAGIVALFVPVVNMISISLPKDVIAVGQGINSTLKSLGQAGGPILATSIMTVYVEPLTGLPSSTAFNVIFVIGIISTTITAGVSLATKNSVVSRPKA